MIKLKNSLSFRTVEEKKDKKILTLLCAGTYFCSYFTRVNYKTVISAIVESEKISMDSAAAVLTGLFITYGLGQLVSGWIGDKIKPVYLISGGLFLSSVMNLILPLKTDYKYMAVVWCVNGFGQALIWPPIVRTLSDYLNEDDYRHSAVKVLWGSNTAVILLYLFCPLIITVSGEWKPIFYISAAVGAAGAVAAFLILLYFEKKYSVIPQTHDSPAVQTQTQTSDISEKKRISSVGLFVPLFTLIIVIMAVQGALRDGVDSWVPSYISSSFNLGTNISILTGVILPIFSIISYIASTAVYEKLIKNEILSSAAFFGGAVVCSSVLIVLRYFTDTNEGSVVRIIRISLTILTLALFVGCMHAVNMICTCFVPEHFKSFGNVSFVSGLTNFGVYIGSASATYGFALIAEKTGWTGTVISWIALSVSGVLLCIACCIPWKKLLESAKPYEKTPELPEKKD